MVADIRFDDGVGWFTINRPSVYNALNRDCMLALSEFVRQVEQNDSIRVAVLAGKGRYFCAGADIPEFLSSLDPEATVPEQKDFLEIVYSTFRALRDLSKPTIAAVNGPAMGGGMELALSCDLVITTDSAKFGDAHATYGIIPGGGNSAHLPRMLPPAIAKYLLFTGEPMSATQMLEHGLVNLIVPQDRLIDEVSDLAQSIAKKSPLVITQMKRLANAAQSRPLEESILDEFQTLKKHTKSADLREGLTAFTERRRPTFTGR